MNVAARYITILSRMITHDDAWFWNGIGCLPMSRALFTNFIVHMLKLLC